MALSGFYTDPFGPTPGWSATMLASMPETAPAASSGFNWGNFNLGNIKLDQAGIGMQIFGAITGAMGTMYSGQIAKMNMRGQAEIAEINARMAESQAQSLLEQGNREIGRMTMQAGKVKSAQKAAMAANGIDIGVGSAAETTATTDIVKELDALTINSNATRAAWAARTQSVAYSNQAIASRAGADAINPGIAAFGSLMNSAGSVASSWYRDRRSSQLAAALGL
jgi:hypothetical protein